MGIRKRCAHLVFHSVLLLSRKKKTRGKKKKAPSSNRPWFDDSFG